jgi:transcriptional/translational regulatory protein YebC/TACO1
MEVRTAVTRNGGTMADPGSVSRLFTRKGVVVVGKSQERGGKPWEVSEDDVLEATLDAGAEDVSDLGDSFEIQSESGDVVAVRTALQAAGIDYDSAEVQFVATMDIPVGEVDVAGKVFRLVDAVDDLDDVQNVYSNADIPDEVLDSIDA